MEGACVPQHVYMSRSEDNPVESVLSTFIWVLGIPTQVLFGCSRFIDWAIWLSRYYFLNNKEFDLLKSYKRQLILLCMSWYLFIEDAIKFSKPPSVRWVTLWNKDCPWGSILYPIVVSYRAQENVWRAFNS